MKKQECSAKERERLYSTKEIAAATGIKVCNWERWRHMKEGPVYIKIGKSIKYELSVVWEWIDRHSEHVPPGL